jgi:hypothetical protein
MLRYRRGGNKRILKMGWEGNGLKYLEQEGEGSGLL